MVILLIAIGGYYMMLMAIGDYPVVNHWWLFY
jgi:hypothetical protein